MSVTLTQGEWLLVRKAAMQWAEQVQGAMPGPEPLLSTINDLLKDRAGITAPSITCPRCLMTSYNPNDIREGYCGACHDWTTPPC